MEAPTYEISNEYLHKLLIITLRGTVMEIDPIFNRYLENVKVTAQ